MNNIDYHYWLLNDKKDYDILNENIKSYCLYNGLNITEIFEFCNGYCERTDKNKKTIIRLKHKNKFRKNGKRVLEVINKNVYVCSIGNDDYILIDKMIFEEFHNDFKNE